LAKRVELAKRIDHREGRQHAQAKAKFVRRAVGREQRCQVQVALERAPRPSPVAVKVVAGHGETGERRGWNGIGLEQFAQTVHL